MTQPDPQKNSTDVGVISKNMFFWLLALIGRTRRQLLLTCLTTAIVSGIISFLLPKWYASTVTVLPPREMGVLGSLSALNTTLRDLGSLRSIAGLGGARGPSYNYLSILESRSTKEALVRRFDLMRVYEISDSSMEKTIKALEGNVEAEIADEGHISITVLDMDPGRAAQMANYYVNILNEININLNVQGATKYREYLEKSVREVNDSLRLYENAFAQFQKRHGLVVVPEDIQGSTQAVAQIYAEKALKEVEVAFLSQAMGKDNPELARRRLEMQVLNDKVATFPDLGVQGLRLYRDLFIQGKILEVLMPMYEQARLEEKRETPSVVVLDRAIPAERKSKPKRLLIILLATLSAATFFVVSYAVWERIRRLELESPGHYEALRSVFRFRKK
jgi:uncharacterized protein involved in exopolysaccharide biosynthesis